VKKLYDVCRGLAVILAVVAAFVTVPYAAAALLVLGAVAGVGNTPEDNNRIFLIALVLMAGAKSLVAIPTLGTYLSSIFGNIGMGAFGAAVMGVSLGLIRRITADWTAA
jgi:hypothetical protein